MSPRDAADLLSVALEAVQLAANTTMDRFQSSDLDVTTKSSAADVVTDADLASERVVLERILESRPDDSFLGEEGTTVTGTSGISWILDPIDSTANFARGIPIWSVSLAAADSHGVLAAVVGCPPLGEVISATRETGLLLNGERTGTRPERDLVASMIAIGWGPRSRGARQALVAGNLIHRVGKVRSPGSPALGLAWTALGRFDAAYYEMDFSEWDIAAGAFLCKCAGLTITHRQPDAEVESPRLLAAPRNLNQPLSKFVFG